MEKTIPFPSVVIFCVELVPLALVNLPTPEPFGTKVRSILVSPPTAEIVGLLPVAALVISK